MIFFFCTTSNSLNPKKVVVEHQSAEDCSSTSNKFLYAHTYTAEKREGVCGKFSRVKPLAFTKDIINDRVKEVSVNECVKKCRV
jgi:hypothetical protein